MLDAGCGSGRVYREAARAAAARARDCGRRHRATWLEAARDYLAPRFGERVSFLHADLLSLDVEQAADVVFSTAALHWVLDHDRLFRGSSTPCARAAACTPVRRWRTTWKRLRDRSVAILSPLRSPSTSHAGGKRGSSPGPRRLPSASGTRDSSRSRPDWRRCCRSCPTRRPIAHSWRTWWFRELSRGAAGGAPGVVPRRPRRGGRQGRSTMVARLRAPQSRGTAPVKIAGVLLAAGASRRMGRHKALLRTGGRSFAAHGLEILWERMPGGGGGARRAGRAHPRSTRVRRRRAPHGEAPAYRESPRRGVATRGTPSAKSRLGAWHVRVGATRSARSARFRARRGAACSRSTTRPCVRPRRARWRAMREATGAFGGGRASAGFAYALVPRYRKRRGHPIAPRRRWRAPIAADRGAADLSDAVRRNARLVGFLDGADPGILTNSQHAQRAIERASHECGCWHWTPTPTAAEIPGGAQQVRS